MIGYYRRSLIPLIAQLRMIHDNPQDNWRLCLPVQETLIRKITYIESQIHAVKKKIAELKKQKSQLKTEDKLHHLNDEIEMNFIKKEGYQHLLQVFRSVGDGIALSYVNKWDLKPLAFKQASGFISGKKGSRLERRCLRTSFKKGHVAFLNDLTNILRHGDITIPIDEFPFTFEIKSGKPRGARSKRQIKQIDKLMKYLMDDKIEDIYPGTGTVVRRPASYPEINHLNELNQLILKSGQQGSAGQRVEQGLFYFVSRSADVKDFTQYLDRICFSAAPIVVFVNMDKHNVKGYYPFTLSINCPEDVFAFYAGELFIFVIVDTTVIKETFHRHGFECGIEQGEWVIQAKRLDDPDMHLEISYHMFGRIFYEFMGLEWMLEELISRDIYNSSRMGLTEEDEVV